MLTLFSCLQGGDIQQELERSRPGKTHLQNRVIYFVLPQHFSPTKLPVYTWEFLKYSGKLGEEMERSDFVTWTIIFN